MQSRTSIRAAAGAALTPRGAGSARRALLASMLATLVLHAALAGGALAWLPENARLVLAFLALVLLPGAGWLAAIGVVPPGGRWLAAGWALGLGVAWLGLQVLGTRLLHLPFTPLAGWALLTGTLPWLAAIVRPSAPAPGTGASRALAGLSGLALAAVLLAALLAAVHVARTPPPLGFNTDSPDHIGTIRRMIAGGDAFPSDAFFRDAGGAGADPRKGLWHPCVALVALLAHADPLAAWTVLSALLAPLFALNAAAFGFLLGGPAAAAIAAWALLLTYGGSLASPALREAVYATKLADQLALAAITAVLADLEGRNVRGRLAAAGLAAGAVATHVFAALHLGVVFAALGAGLLVRERGAGPNVRRLLATSLALALPCLPYLLWRAQSAYAPANLIHTEPQGLLLIAGRAMVVDPGVLADWLGVLGVVVPLSWWAWARAASRPPVLFLLTSSLAVAVLMYFPPLVGALQPRLGYLLMRFVWLVPLPGALAFAIPGLLHGVRRGPGGARAASVLSLAGLALLCTPVLGTALRAFVRPAGLYAHDAVADPRRWRDALAWMDTHLPRGSVVLSDPATSYSIPMLTRHWVTALVDQHSSPNDPLALRRILDARDALDPYAPWSVTRDVVRRRGATAIALNDRFPEPPYLDYWAPDHAWFVAARARLDGMPGAFRRVWDSGDFVVYAIDRAALDTLEGGGGARPCERAWNPAAAPVARPVAPGTPDLVSLHLEPARAVPGDSLAVTMDWHARAPMPPGSYRVALRFDRPLPPGVASPAWCAKPVTRLHERLRHERYGFRVERRRMAGNFGVDCWSPETIVRDSFMLRVPGDLAPGDYRVQAVMLRAPHYPVVRLADLLRDDDRSGGPAAGTLHLDVRVAPR